MTEELLLAMGAEKKGKNRFLFGDFSLEPTAKEGRWMVCHQGSLIAYADSVEELLLGVWSGGGRQSVKEYKESVGATLRELFGLDREGRGGCSCSRIY